MSFLSAFVSFDFRCGGKNTKKQIMERKKKAEERERTNNLGKGDRISVRIRKKAR